ncbi:hypothetical protein L1987_18842 [Smallanthus sonchifolius]|uniref:Uncharacterized protein n=1 Tax=Smallanthus sonchifolius TaxID=185202 RepID=A0ACB9J1W2_9ASTR|nr:hypothetical protein L1987_18842 [Smallanthus sonchifolius]
MLYVDQAIENFHLQTLSISMSSACVIADLTKHQDVLNLHPQGYEDAGDFSGRERLKTSIHVNLGLIGLFGLTLLIMMQKDCEIPKSIWRNTDWTTRQKVLSHKIAKIAKMLDEAHQELSNHSSEATSKQMSKLLIWRCIVWKQLKKLFAVLLGCMSTAIRLAEATLLPNGVDLSVFSILIKYLATQEMLVQVVAFVPVFYMCICSYYSLFKIAMGNIDNTVPFFRKGFNKLYPVIMVVYTLLVASGFFHRIIKVGGIWKRIIFQNEADDLDGVDPSRLFILKKERAWLEQRHNIGEGVVPLTRNFNDTSIDIESGNISTGVKMKPSSSLLNVNMKESHQRNEGRRYSMSREAMSSKYAAIMASNTNIASAKVSLLDSKDSWPGIIATDGPSSLMSSTWLSVKSGLQNLKTKNNYTQLNDSSKEIFQKLKRPDRDEDELDDLVGSCDEDGEWKLAMPAFLPILHTII